MLPAHLESRVFAGRDEHARIGGPRDAVDGRDVAAQGGDEPARWFASAAKSAIGLSAHVFLLHAPPPQELAGVRKTGIANVRLTCQSDRPTT